MDEMTQEQALATMRAIDILDRVALAALFAGETEIARTLINATRYLVSGRIWGMRGVAGVGLQKILLEEIAAKHWGPRV